MTNPNVSMPGYRINEYRLAIPLSEDLQEKIMHIRTQLHEKYKVALPFQLKPGLTILHCYAYEGMEAKLLERIQQVAMRIESFKVELLNFSAYPSHTIYINVPTRSPFNDLVKELKVVKSLTRVPDQEPHFIKEPHLIVAQKLKPFQFTRMWLDCEHTHFSGRFIADSMTLVRRNEAHPAYEVIRQYQFSGLAMGVKQGALFF